MRTQRWKELNREKHGKIGTRRKKAGFKNILKRDLSKNKSKKKKKPRKSLKKGFRLLRTLSKYMKTSKLPPLSKPQRKKHVSWSKNYMKTYFSTIIFSGQCRNTPDGCIRG